MEQPSSGADAPRPDFSNPAVADDINNPPESQLKSFFVNLGIITAALVALLVVLNLAASFLTPFIPFEWERSLVGREFFRETLDEKGEARQAELTRLGDALSAVMDLPEGVSVSVCYNPGRMVNAFATLGGNVVVYQGLIDHMESEDELAMVVAHEIGHVKNRDAVKGVVRAVGLMLLLSGIEDAGSYVQSVSTVGMSSYSRSQEEAADAEAVKALGRLYGHAGGAGEFFSNLATKVEKRSVDDKVSALPKLTASHPDTLRRLQRSREEADRNDIPRQGDLTPLPEAFE